MINGHSTKHDTVLIADDNVAITNLFAFFLKSDFRGSIIKTFDGDEAVKKCHEYHPSVVFMDIEMPIKDGITAVKELRESGFENPILVISAWAAQNDYKGLDKYADEVIPKPINRDAFLSLFSKYYSGNDAPALDNFSPAVATI